MRDLRAYPLILTGQDTSVRQIIERTLAEERLPVQVAQEATYMTTAIGMVQAGLGIAILPESALVPEPRHAAARDRDQGTGVDPRHRHPHADGTHRCRPRRSGWWKCCATPSVKRGAASTASNAGADAAGASARAASCDARVSTASSRALKGSGFATGPLSVKSMITSSAAE